MVKDFLQTKPLIVSMSQRVLLSPIKFIIRRDIPGFGRSNFLGSCKILGLCTGDAYAGENPVSASMLNAHGADGLSVLAVKIVDVADVIKKPTKKIMRCNVMTLCPPNGCP